MQRQNVTLYETFGGRGLILAPGLKLEFESFALAEAHVGNPISGMRSNIRKQFGSPIKQIIIQEVCHEATGINQ
jgi:hypothetical protein